MVNRLLCLSCLCCLLLMQMGCRGPIRNPAALTPLLTPTPIWPPTATVPPTATIPPTPTRVVIIHLVQPNETLYGLSLQYGVSVEELRAFNGLGPEAVLQVGQELRVPQ